MAGQAAAKTISIKFVGAKRAIETLEIMPATSVADVLKTLGLGNAHQLSDAKNPEAVYRPTDDLYASTSDGALLYASSLVDAG